ncbi:MAG: hypothetical protein QOI29_2137 [Mycobacterium sp.]|nr:hypothetical protein [Mycobacterium sp.]
MTDQPPPPPGNYPPPPPGNYPPPPPGNYPPPPPGNYPPPPPGGYPPPPPAGYPPPPPAGYPPPPPPGYPPPPPPGAQGYPPPPPPGYPPPSPGGFPPAGGPGFGQSYSVGDAFSWAWNKFSKNAGPLIVATLVYGLVVVVLQAIISLVSSAVSPSDYSSYSSDATSFSFSYGMSGVGSIIVSIIGWFLSLIVAAAIQSAYIGGILDIANGQQVSMGSFFRPRNIGNVIIAGLIVGIVTTIGFILCVIPGVIASIMLMFTVVALLDRNLSPVDAVKSSFDLSKANFGNVILAWLVLIATFIVGALLCGVGLLVAAPVATLFLVYTYRILSGGQVAELNPQPLPPGPPQGGPQLNPQPLPPQQ